MYMHRKRAKNWEGKRVFRLVWKLFFKIILKNSF